MLLHRLDDHLAFESPGTPELPSVAVRRLWYDTVAHCHGPALVAAADSFGADRLVLGTDFPYEDGEVFVRAVSYVTGSGLPPRDATAILHANAAALLGPARSRAVGREPGGRPGAGRSAGSRAVGREPGGRPGAGPAAGSRGLAPGRAAEAPRDVAPGRAGR
ncbi:amidohydrolase [Streptomyces sp. NBC_00435]|uniref:amidohydrolase family protein n=1 Tax=Streptomyces sp. NBC_00435 TaxID=2903649 RepID=UPI002E1AF80E